MAVEKLAYRPKEAAAALGVSRETIFARIKDGSLRSVKAGKARLIMADELRRYLASLGE